MRNGLTIDNAALHQAMMSNNSIVGLWSGSIYEYDEQLRQVGNGHFQPSNSRLSG